MNESFGSYYDILEIAPTAPQYEVTRAYERAKLTYSTDNPALYTVFTVEEARDFLLLIEESFSILGNAVYRSRYDELIKNPEFQNVPITYKMVVGSQNGATSERQKIFFKPEFQTNEILEEQIKSEVECDGSFLRKVREYKNISKGKMCEITRINSQYLQALESNDWRSLPAAVFVRGFVVQIARVLHLDEKRTADSYMKIYRGALGLEA